MLTSKIAPASGGFGFRAIGTSQVASTTRAGRCCSYRGRRWRWCRRKTTASSITGTSQAFAAQAAKRCIENAFVPQHRILQMEDAANGHTAGRELYGTPFYKMPIY